MTKIIHTDNNVVVENCFVFRQKRCIFVYTEIYRRQKTIDFYYLFHVFSSFGIGNGRRSTFVIPNHSIMFFRPSYCHILIYISMYFFLSFFKEIILTMVILFIATAAAMCLPIKKKTKKNTVIVQYSQTRRDGDAYLFCADKPYDFSGVKINRFALLWYSHRYVTFTHIRFGTRNELRRLGLGNGCLFWEARVVESQA